MRNYLAIHYSVAKPETETEVSAILERLDRAEAAMEHLTGIFHLLEFLDEDTHLMNPEWVKARYTKLCDALHQVGQLGAAIADGAFGECAEASDEIFNLEPAQATGKVEREHQKSKNKK